MPQESQYLQDHSHALDELDEIYRNQPDASINYRFKSERVADPGIRKLYWIADEITKARSRRLDSQFFTHAEHQQTFVSSVTKVIFGKALSMKRPEPMTEAVLHAKESEVGATIFGPMALNEIQREFFYERRIADRDSWFFHQAVSTPTGDKDVTIHYEVNPKHVVRLCSHPDTKNEFIEGEELRNFSTAVEVYHGLVMDQVYGDDTDASKKAA